MFAFAVTKLRFDELARGCNRTLAPGQPKELESGALEKGSTGIRALPQLSSARDSRSAHHFGQDPPSLFPQVIVHITCRFQAHYVLCDFLSLGQSY